MVGFVFSFSAVTPSISAMQGQITERVISTTANFAGEEKIMRMNAVSSATSADLPALLAKQSQQTQQTQQAPQTQQEHQAPPVWNMQGQIIGKVINTFL